MSKYFYYDSETLKGVGILNEQASYISYPYCMISDELALSVYDSSLSTYRAEYLSYSNGVVVYNFEFYRWQKQKEFNGIFKSTDCIIINNDTCIDLDNSDNVDLQKVHCDNQVEATNSTKIKAKNSADNLAKFYTLTNKADMQTLINNILCARAQYITLKEENQIKIDQATSQDDLSAIDLTNINLDFLDLR